MKINRIIIVTLICITIMLSICTIGLKEELTLTQNELYENKNILEQIADELDVTKEELRAETNKTNELNESLNDANEVIEALKAEKYSLGYTVTNTEIDMIAKTVWGEARGCSKLQQSGVVWCILNRVDDGYWGNTVAEVVKAPGQFHGYKSHYPVDDDIETLVRDVVVRWQLEKLGCGNVGRTLPSRFLYFASNNKGTNTFRTSAGSGEKWDWNWGNPYK